MSNDTQNHQLNHIPNLHFTKTLIIWLRQSFVGTIPKTPVPLPLLNYKQTYRHTDLLRLYIGNLRLLLHSFIC